MTNDKIKQTVKTLEENGYTAEEMYGILENSNPIEFARYASPRNIWGDFIRMFRPDIDIEKLSSAAQEIDDLFSELYRIAEDVLLNR